MDNPEQASITKQPGMHKVRKAASKKSERRSQMKGHGKGKHRRGGYGSRMG